MSATGDQDRRPALPANSGSYRDSHGGDVEVDVKDSEIAVHPNPLLRARANFIIMADVTDPDTGKRLEQLWARDVGDNRFEICCIPFFAYDLALGDIVSCAPAGARQYVNQNVVEQSGHYTFRVWFGRPSAPALKLEVVQELAALQARLEWASENLLAVDAADWEHAQPVADRLQARQDAGDLVYEAGRTH